MRNKGSYYKYKAISIVFSVFVNLAISNTIIHAADASFTDSLPMIIHRAHEGDLEKVKRILEFHPSAINYRGDNNGTPMHSACSAGHLDLVKFLIENGADIEAEDKYGRTPILMGVNLDIAKYLISKGADYEKTQQNEASVLHTAADDGNIELLQYWVEKGINLELGSHKVGTALLQAACGDNKDAVEYLLSVGADINAVDKDGELILHKAANATDYSLLKDDPNLSETTNNTGKTLKFLLNKNLDINQKDNNGDTPLHKVVYYRTQISAELLISHNADVNIQNNEGKTPLFIAANFSSNDDNLKMVKLLVEKGADVNLRTKDNDTALHVAIRNSNYEMTKYLLEKGAEVNPCRSTSGTALHSAAGLARPDLVKLLIEHGANINARDKADHRVHGTQSDLSTPLHHAAISLGRIRNGKKIELETVIEVITLLLNNGADINAENSLGLTLMDLVFQSDNRDLIKFLEEKGAKRNIKEGEEYAYGEKQRWIESLRQRMPNTFYDEKIINDWWPLDKYTKYTYKITGSTWEKGNKWIDKEFSLKIVPDQNDKNKFNFKVDGFDEFPYKGLVIENNRIFAINENGKEKNSFILFPLHKDMFFSNEENEHQFLTDAINNSTDESLYGPVMGDMWHILRVEGERYYATKSMHRPLSYTFEINTGLIKWHIPGGYELTLIKINDNDYIQPGYIKDGLYCSLHAKKFIWNRSEKPQLFVDMENKGYNNYTVNLSDYEIDINGKRFVSLYKNTDSLTFGQDKQYKEIEITLDNSLVHKEKGYGFRFSPDEYEYNIYIIYRANLSTKNTNGTVFMVSNPVELDLEIEPIDPNTSTSTRRTNTLDTMIYERP